MIVHICLHKLVREVNSRLPLCQLFLQELVIIIFVRNLPLYVVFLRSIAIFFIRSIQYPLRFSLLSRFCNGHKRTLQIHLPLRVCSAASGSFLNSPDVADIFYRLPFPSTVFTWLRVYFAVELYDSYSFSVLLVFYSGKVDLYSS